VVTYLLAHGANPRQRLPFDASQSVVAYARTLKSPVVALLEAPPEAAQPDAPRLASTTTATTTATAAMAPVAATAVVATAPIGALAIK